MQTLPVNSSDKQTFTTQLGNYRFTFYFYFNERSRIWHFDMTDATTGEVLVLGVPMVLAQDYLEPYAWGLGELFATDLTFSGVEAGPEELGVRVLPSYMSPADVLFSLV